MWNAFARLTVFSSALAAGAAEAQNAKGRISFEVQGESVRPAELSRGPAPNDALGQARNGYHYLQCCNYYRWFYDCYSGWQRYFVGTRCY